MGAPHISLSAETVGHIFGLPITNSVIMTWLVMVLLTLFAYFASRNIKEVPSNLQSVAEVIIDGLRNLFKGVVGEHYIDKFFPILGTIFIFVMIGNWLGLLPGVGSIGIFKTESEEVALEEHVPVEAEVADNSHASPVVEDAEHVADEVEETTVSAVTSESKTEGHGKVEFIPLFRGATADLNTTLALAIIAVLAVQYYGVKTIGAKAHISKYFNFSNPIMFAVGLLEIVSEFSRIMSFAFRLFGNIFAGEVLLTVIAFLMPLIAPLPFLGLELFVGFIQALIFSMLTAVFLNIATISHENH